MTSAAAKKVTAPSVEERAETLWNELDSAGRATLLDTLEHLADAELTKQAEARKGGSIPHLWFRQQWLVKANDSPTRALVLAIRGGRAHG
jgi:hypothetical protein